MEEINFMRENNFENINTANNDREKEILRESGKGKLGIIFDSIQGGEERIGEIKESFEEILQNLKEKDEIRIDLDKCANIKDKNEFIKRVSEILKPATELAIEDFIKNNVGDKKRWLLNEVLSYTVNGDIIQIHIFSGKKEYGLAQKVFEGLKELAEAVNKDPNIKTIEAISWIVSKHPKLIEKKMGFTIGGDVDPEYIKEHFDDEDGEIKKAYISRDDFLNRYLNK